MLCELRDICRVGGDVKVKSLSSNVTNYLAHHQLWERTFKADDYGERWLTRLKQQALSADKRLFENTTDAAYIVRRRAAIERRVTKY